MKPSPEIQAIVERIFAALNARDAATFINLCSEEPGGLFIGTDPTEWWEGHPTMAAVIEAQIREFEAAGVTFSLSGVEAYAEGTVGWCAARPVVRGAEGVPREVRFTGVLRLDRGFWRFVQWHLSVGGANEEVLGVQLTTAIDTIAAAVRDDRPDLRAMVAVDGTVTIAFSDIEASTEIAERLGDQRWLDRLREHNKLVAELVAAEGGQIVQWLGDGHMMAFPSASRALRCAQAIQRALDRSDSPEVIRLRIGLHTGEPPREADDFFGHAVIVAARVTSQAAGGEILVSSVVAELTRSLGPFRFGPQRVVELKGIAGSHAVFPVIWEESPDHG